MMGDMGIIGGYMKSTVEPGDAETAATKYGTLDFELRGPFSRADPDGSEGTSVHEDLKSYNIGGWNQYELGIVAIDSTTGEPKDIVHFGGRGHDVLSDVRASSDISRLAASGCFSGNLTFTGLPTILSANSEATGTMDYSVASDGFVVVLDSDLVPIWAKRWPESAIGANPWTPSRCLSSACCSAAASVTRLLTTRTYPPSCKARASTPTATRSSHSPPS